MLQASDCDLGTPDANVLCSRHTVPVPGTQLCCAHSCMQLTRVTIEVTTSILAVGTGKQIPFCVPVAININQKSVLLLSNDYWYSVSSSGCEQRLVQRPTTCNSQTSDIK